MNVIIYHLPERNTRYYKIRINPDYNRTVLKAINDLDCVSEVFMTYDKFKIIVSDTSLWHSVNNRIKEIIGSPLNFNHLNFTEEQMESLIPLSF